jgi:hypothetical protein
MKIRQGFVSNSSSSSFIISTDKISVAQLKLLREHANSKEFKEDEWSSSGDEWDIDEEDGYIICSTFMDNFDLYEYAKKIGIKEEDIKNYYQD